MTGGLADTDPNGSLVRLSDSAGRELGYGFPADARGTLLTAYQTVADLGDVPPVRAGDAVVRGLTRCPELGLALLTVDQPAVARPLPVLLGALAEPGRPVAVPREGAPPLLGTLLGTGTALSAWPGPVRLLPGILLLELPGAAAPGTALPAGLPVLDPATGAVLGLLAPGLRGLPAGLTPAVPITGHPELPPELAELLARNAVDAPAYGPALNLGGMLQLASRQLAAAVAGPGRVTDLAADRVERADGLAGEEPEAPLTVLVGEPGSGRTTELAALAVRRAGGPRALPTLWLRGADLWSGDSSVTDAVGRALAPDVTAAAAAQVCAAGGRPLLVLLDGPEEAPAVLGAPWWERTLRWLGESGARLLVACRPESWEPGRWESGRWDVEHGVAQVRLHRLGPLRGSALERAARRYGVTAPEAATAPLVLRLAGELRAAGVAGASGAGRAELYGGWLDLCCLRIAQRLAEEGPRPASHRKGAVGRPAVPVSPGRVRRLAATVAGRLHEAARRMLGPGQGGLGRAAFEELFPVSGGWARAVLAEGLFVPAGDGYRLAHEEIADWLLGLHLDLEAALCQLLAAGERRGVPRHRVGTVEAALRTVGETWGEATLNGWLDRLWQALADPGTGPEARWWASRLLAAGLRASPAPGAHRELLERLAERIAQATAGTGGFAALREGPRPATRRRPTAGGAPGQGAREAAEDGGRASERVRRGVRRPRVRPAHRYRRGRRLTVRRFTACRLTVRRGSRTPRASVCSAPASGTRSTSRRPPAGPCCASWSGRTVRSRASSAPRRPGCGPAGQRCSRCSAAGSRTAAACRPARAPPSPTSPRTCSTPTAPSPSTS
ncbi:hypothetical protein [Kitasatospora azatica]|uniref:hypothetical protein n=1 Tax=Kitasatospora azatica TaxID=58347 RepID=UPI000691459C|nr:hypothetical protein [Kitasatospora azatica]